MTAVAPALSSAAALDLPPRSVGVSWLGQSGVALRFPGRTVLVDPFLSAHPERLVPPAFAPEEARNIDVVLLTHDHLDHLDERALPVIARVSPAARFIVPEQLVARVALLGIEPGRIAGLGEEETLAVCGLTIYGVAACHGESPADAYRTGPFRGYVVAHDEVHVYHSGDTILFPSLPGRLRAIGVDLALLPINGRDAARESAGIVGNLDAEEAAELAAACGADAVVPLHWDMFASNSGDPGALVSAAACTVITLRHCRPFAYLAPRHRRR